MAEVKLSQLAATTSATEADYIMVVQNGVSKRMSLGTLLKNLNSNDSIKLNPMQRPINTTVASKDNPALLTIDGVNNKIGINAPIIDAQAIFQINGIVKIGGSSTDGILLDSSEIITHPTTTAVTAAPLSILRESSALEIYGACTYVLGSGVEGQTKCIYLKSIDTVGSTATITVAAGLGFNRVTLSTTVGNALTMKFVNATWICVGNNGAILFTA